MRNIVVAIVLVLSTGCAHWFGPAHGVFYAVGSTPNKTPCELSVTPVGSSGNRQGRAVSGDFRESFTISPSRKGHRIALTCDDKVVTARTFKYGRDVHIGGELMINGSAP